MSSPPTGERALRTCMQALVLLNLVFIQMTGAAGMQWLAPLFVLTLAAPLLERYRERLTYRALWNVGVVCFFLVLVRHALRADLAYVRESGLVLAVLCQVHLLNNLRSDQRPDLLFFNAFLIAIITGFMNRGVGFPLAFLVFAPSLVVGLQLLSATRGGHVLAPAVTRRLVLDGLRRSGLLLVLCFGVFLFWPRDFQRKPFFHGKFDMNNGGLAELEIGFNEELVLGRGEPVASADRAALRVTLIDGNASAVPSLWRGATLGATEGGAWHVLGPVERRRAGVFDERWNGRRGRVTRSDPQAAPLRLEVVRFEQGTERLFAPLGAHALQLAPEQAHLLLRPNQDGTIDAAETADVRYELRLAAAPERTPGGRWPEELPSELLAYVDLPASDNILRARELAERLAARLPEDAEQHELVELLSDHLARSYAYLPPGSEDAASTLDEFLRGDGGGHCEFFASALATMLRSREVPCRVVTGLRSTRWDAEGRVLSFGSRDAHAWVEVLDPQAGWYSADASPLLAAEEVGTSLWARLRLQARLAWLKVTGFDDERRAALLAWARALPGRLNAVLARHPVSGVLALLALTLAVVLRVRKRLERTPPAVRTYRSAVRRARLRLLPGETPRELLLRARSGNLPAARVLELESATRRHEALRYGAHRHGARRHGAHRHGAHRHGAHRHGARRHAASATSRV